MSTNKNLGIVSIVPKDNWSSTETYQRLNLVRHKNASYMAKLASKNVEPGVATYWTQYWMLLNEDVYGKELPTVSTSNEGQFLRVNSSGQWVASTVESAETTTDSF